MAKKDFTTADTGRVYTAISEATADPDTRKPRKTYTEDEAEALALQMTTVGRKGVKLPRINMAFAPDVYQYIKIMSSATGKTMSEFLTQVVRQHAKDHADLYEKAQALIAEFKDM